MQNSPSSNPLTVETQSATPNLSRTVEELSSSIDENLTGLATKLNEIKETFLNSFGLNQIEANGLANAFTSFLEALAGTGVVIANLTPEQINTRFDEYAVNENVQLTPNQRMVFGYARESMSFWNNNLPSGVPSMPGNVMGMIFGIIQKESRFRFDAANPRSSARGLGQFLTSTWNGYIERYGPQLVASGVFTQEELNNPNARTENPRLMVFMINRYLIKSFESLNRAGFLPNGWQTENIEFMLYLCHHHGAGDAVKHLRYLQARTPEEKNRIRASMRNPQFLDNWDYGEQTARVMSEWQSRFQSGASQSSGNVA